jgi:hypothetical protein
MLARLSGIKLAADLPQWFYQSYFTNPAERKRIIETLDEKEAELGERKGGAALDGKKTKLEEAVNASKFLTKEQKSALIKKLNDEVETYEKAELAAREERNEKISKILKEAIQTRMKGYAVAKEALNSALVVSGLAMVRAATLGTVKLTERAVKVNREINEGTRSGGFFKEWLWKGLTETANKLAGGGADTWAGKGLNIAQGMSTVGVGAGIGLAAYSEFLTDHTIQSSIENSLRELEEKGAVRAGLSNMIEPLRRIFGLVGLGNGADVGPGSSGAGSHAPDAGATHAPDAGAEQAPDASQAAGSPVGATPEGGTQAAEVAAGITTPEVTLSDFPDTQVELATVVKGDGILKVLERQLEANPSAFGYKGDLADTHAIEAWAKASALDEARSLNIVRLGGDTRLTSDAIGRLAILAKATPDGGIDLAYFDKTTGQELYLADMRASDLFYEHGNAPGQIPTQVEAVETAGASPPGDPAPLEVAPAANIPDTLSHGAVRIFIDDGKITGLQLGEVSPETMSLVQGMVDPDLVNPDNLNTAREIFLMNDALKELEAGGNGDSAQASFIREQLTVILNTFGDTLNPVNGIVKEAALEAEKWAASIPAVAVTPDVGDTYAEGTEPTPKGDVSVVEESEPLRRFFGRSGKVRFSYDRDGNVRDAFIPAYIPRPAAIDAALSQWDLTREAVEDHFIEKRGAWEPTVGGMPIERDVAPYVTNESSGLDYSARGESARLISRIDHLARQEATLREMETRGLASSPEYAYWKQETETFRKFVTGEVKKEFPTLKTK